MSIVLSALIILHQPDICNKRQGPQKYSTILQYGYTIDQIVQASDLSITTYQRVFGYEPPVHQLTTQTAQRVVTAEFDIPSTVIAALSPKRLPRPIQPHSTTRRTYVQAFIGVRAQCIVPYERRELEYSLKQAALRDLRSTKVAHGFPLRRGTYLQIPRRVAFHA